ncbi:MAG: hypothetical protein ACLP50_26630 [Solirubrobacteraceae bacterium]|jgi:hypothetical protein
MVTLSQLIERLQVQADDHGCEPCFEHLAQLLEMPDSASEALLAAAAHLRSCPACREDAEGLLALITAETAPERRDTG